VRLEARLKEMTKIVKKSQTEIHRVENVGNFKEMRLRCVEWIQLTLDKVQWRLKMKHL